MFLAVANPSQAPKYVAKLGVVTVDTYPRIEIRQPIGYDKAK
jgi:hypothetical protein